MALVRPNKSIDEVDAKAVRKKMKDKSFARAVNREHVAFVIEALKPVAEELGIGGTSPT